MHACIYTWQQLGLIGKVHIKEGKGERYRMHQSWLLGLVIRQTQESEKQEKRERDSKGMDAADARKAKYR
jgi:hypothetical protein